MALLGTPEPCTWSECRPTSDQLDDWPVALSGAQSRPNCLDYLRPRRQYAQSGPGPTVNDCLAVDEYLELPVRSADQLDLRIEFAPQSRRHTDGVQSGHSVCAGADFDSSHASPCRPNDAAMVRRLRRTVSVEHRG